MNCIYCNQPLDPIGGAKEGRYTCDCGALFRYSETQIERILLIFRLRDKWAHVAIDLIDKDARISAHHMPPMGVKIPFDFAQRLTPANVEEKIKTYLTFS